MDTATGFYPSYAYLGQQLRGGHVSDVESVSIRGSCSAMSCTLHGRLAWMRLQRKSTSPTRLSVP
jgi:hypothetical protein